MQTAGGETQQPPAFTWWTQSTRGWTQGTSAAPGVHIYYAQFYDKLNYRKISTYQKDFTHYISF